MAAKQENFQKVIDGENLKYKCSLCSRQLSSKQNILHHLHKTHGLCVETQKCDSEASSQECNVETSSQERDVETSSQVSNVETFSQVSDVETSVARSDRDTDIDIDSVVSVMDDIRSQKAAARSQMDQDTVTDIIDVSYVKLWGPLWAWSCFGFEDNNAMLLQAVHGTGVVTKQIMWYKQVEATLRRKSLHEVKQKIWKKTYKAENCDVSGKMTAIGNDGTENLLVKLGVDSDRNVKLISRISINGRNFCSLNYTRMKKRACSYVLYEDTNVGCVEYFVINTDSGVVYAVLEKYDSCEDVQLSQLPAGKHLVPITATGIKYVIPADSLIDTLVYIKVCPEVSACISLMPSTHGHAIFK
ncbi:uncharacterized protein LOC127866023 [Dreissena polymorpha]|uniref:uncharacterized protein LOC127866023 n=1 Tax=Dreissena polymorpha TaxID=45954 RepID=UPI002263CD7F|nr:uncharacterized protein LOC127866023 [Dreissena polymorpha]